VLARLNEAGLRPVARRSVSLFRAGPLKRALPARWLAAADGLLQRPTAALAPAPSACVRAVCTRPGPDGLAPEAALFRAPPAATSPCSPRGAASIAPSVTPIGPARMASTSSSEAAPLRGNQQSKHGRAGPAPARCGASPPRNLLLTKNICARYARLLSRPTITGYNRATPV
jgi:hypothetical protein